MAGPAHHNAIDDRRRCLIDDGDCVHGGRLRRHLCDRHYGWLLRYGTTDRYQRQTPHPSTVDLRADADMRCVQSQLAACRRGTEPAETLPAYARERLVRELWASHWTDEEIATWTRMTTYTTARIRARLGLAPHRAQGAAA